MGIAHSEIFFSLLGQTAISHPVRFFFNGEQRLLGTQAALCGQQSTIIVRIKHERFFRRVLSQGNLGLAESFMAGEFEVDEGRLHDLLTVLLESRIQDRLPNTRALFAIMHTRIANLLRSRVRNVRTHYDLSLNLFQMFLDTTMTYSCGYIRSVDDSLEQLQFNKMERICKKLRLQKGELMLDIGCGFGGLLIHAAKHYGVAGVGITVSQEQFRQAQINVKQAGLSSSIEIRLQDYRESIGTYDKVVSVGMMEHVLRREYRRFFRVLGAHLNPKGLGLLHTIGCNSSRNDHDHFIQKYIFPGSAQPRLSEIANGLEHNGLAILDVENMIRHYAPTALGWLERFRNNRIALEGRYDQVFQRMWEYYLSCAIAAAKASNAALYQVLFTNDVTIEIPLQRV